MEGGSGDSTKPTTFDPVYQAPKMISTLYRPRPALFMLLCGNVRAGKGRGGNTLDASGAAE